MSYRLSLVAALLVRFATTASAQQAINWEQTVLLESDASSWTRMAKLSDGSWLAAYMYATTPNRIRLKRSYDNMRTWQFVTEIIEPGRDLDNPTFCVLPTGAIELAIRSVITGQSYYIETYVSNDMGNTFQYQSQVDWDHGIPGVFEPYLYILPDGTLACFYTTNAHANENPSYSQTLSEKVSSDGGNTWGPEIFAVAQPGAARPGEANIVALPGNQLALFYEMCGSENCLGHVTYSTDGVNWSGVGPVVPYTFQDLQAVEMSSGLIIATSNLKVLIVSTDYTNSWINTQALVSFWGGWPALYQTGPNEFAVALTGAGTNNTAGEYIWIGTIDPSALQTTTIGSCHDPTQTRQQNCR